MIPQKPSECVAAVSLSEDGADQPYVSIFYTREEGAIYFFGVEVDSIDENNDGDKFLVYTDGLNDDNTNPDEIIPVARGWLTDEGGLTLLPLEENAAGIEIDGEAQTLTFISVIRAVFQMQGELAKS